MFSVGKCVKNFLLSSTLALIILGDSFLGFFVAEFSDGVSGFLWSLLANFCLVGN